MLRGVVPGLTFSPVEVAVQVRHEAVEVGVARVHSQKALGKIALERPGEGLQLRGCGPLIAEQGRASRKRERGRRVHHRQRRVRQASAARGRSCRSCPIS